MVTIRHVFQCDVCGRQATDNYPNEMAWGIDWKQPTLPGGWKILIDSKSRIGKLICARHVCDIRDARYIEIIEAVVPRRAGVGA
jgi:hypothetical protein